jgi:predicted DCC family thiol-disulfide oxidoreductase YuxK
MESTSQISTETVEQTPASAIILFDGVCNFCNSSINFIIDHDPDNNFKFASLQSATGQRILKEFNRNIHDFDSVILLQDQKIYEKSAAALAITQKLTGYWKYLSVFSILPTSLLDFVYDLIAKNRYKLFGKLAVCRMPTPALKERFL